MAAFLDGCRFNPTAGGTSDWTYASAVTGYQSPAAANVANGRLYKYRAESADLSQWELGAGAYNTTTGVLARTNVLYNSSGTTAKINFSTVPQVAIVALKEDLISIEEANSFTTAQKQQACSNIGVTAIGQAALGQIPGTTGTTQPAAGFIGELISATGSASPGSGSVANLCSVTLTSGVWDIDAIGNTGGPGATTTTNLALGISTASGTLSTGIVGSNSAYRFSAGLADLVVPIPLMRRRVTVSTSTTYYLNFSASYSGSSYSCSGDLEARRVS